MIKDIKFLLNISNFLLPGLSILFAITSGVFIVFYVAEKEILSKVLTFLTILFLLFLGYKIKNKFPDFYLINPGFYYSIAWSLTLIVFVIPLIDFEVFVAEQYIKLLLSINITTITWLILTAISKNRRVKAVSNTESDKKLNYSLIWGIASVFGIISFIGSLIIFKNLFFAGDIVYRRLNFVILPRELMYPWWLVQAAQVSAFLYGYSLIIKGRNLFQFFIAGLPFYSITLYALTTGRRQQILFVGLSYLFGFLISKSRSNLWESKNIKKILAKRKKILFIVTGLTIWIFLYTFGFIHEASFQVSRWDTKDLYTTEFGKIIGKVLFAIIPLGVWEYIVLPIYAYQLKAPIVETFATEYGRRSFWPIEYISVKILGLPYLESSFHQAEFFEPHLSGSPGTIFLNYINDFKSLAILANIIVILVSFALFKHVIRKTNFSIFILVIFTQFLIFWTYSPQFSYFMRAGQVVLAWTIIAHFSYKFLLKNKKP